MVLSSYLGVSKQILIIQRGDEIIPYIPCLETQLSITEDTANRLGLKHLARVVHFHLTIHFMPIHKMKRDLLEGEGN
jgi:hypothetical protein